MGNICHPEIEQNQQQKQRQLNHDEVERLKITLQHKQQHQSDYYQSSYDNLGSLTSSNIPNNFQENQQQGTFNQYGKETYDDNQFESFVQEDQQKQKINNSKQSMGSEYHSFSGSKHSFGSNFKSFTNENDQQQQQDLALLSDNKFQDLEEKSNVENNKNQNQNIQKQQQQVLNLDLDWGSSVLDEEKFQFCLSQFEIKPDEDKQWKLGQKKAGIYKIYKKSVKSSSSILVRSEFTIQNQQAFTVFNTFYDVKNRLSWDDSIAEMNIVKQIDDKTDIYYCVRDPSKTITKRDWLMRRFYKLDYPFKGDITVIEYSIEHKSIQETNKTVRAEAKYVGYMVRQVEKDVEVCIVSDNDIKGNIPSWIVNSFADKGTRDWINLLLKQFK